MPKDLFQEFNIDAKNEPKDLFETFGIAPDDGKQTNSPSMSDFLKQSLSLKSMANNPLIDFINNLGGGVAQGGFNISKNVINLLPKLLANKNLVNADTSKFEPFYDPNTISAETGKAITGIGLPVTKFSNLPRIVEAGAQGAIAAPLLSDSNNREELLKNAELGGGLGVGLSSLTSAVPYAGSKFMKYLANRAKQGEGSLRTPEEVKSLNEQLEGTPVNIGDILGAPRFSRSSSAILRNIPFSGAAQKEDKLIGKTQNFAEDLLNKFKGKSNYEDIDDELKNAISKNEENNYKKSKILYNNVFEKAKNKNIEVNLSNVKDSIKNLLQERKKSLLPSSGQSVLNSLQKNINDKNNISFSDAHFNRSDLSDIARGLEKQGNYKDARIVNKVKEALENDMDSSIKQSNNDSLYALWKDANKNFKENVLPYRNNNIKNIINNESDASKISNELQKTKNNKIFEHLSNANKNKVIYQHFTSKVKPSDAETSELSQEKLVSAYKNLPVSVKNKWFKPDDKENFNKLINLVNLSKEAKGSANLPFTGARTADNLLKMGIPASALHYMGSSIPGIAALTGSTIGLSRKLTNALYGDKLKNAYINQRFNYPEKTEKISKALQKALLANRGSQ